MLEYLYALLIPARFTPTGKVRDVHEFSVTVLLKYGLLALAEGIFDIYLSGTKRFRLLQ
jgi:hypothetical protein